MGAGMSAPMSSSTMDVQAGSDRCTCHRRSKDAPATKPPVRTPDRVRGARDAVLRPGHVRDVSTDAQRELVAHATGSNADGAVVVALGGAQRGVRTEGPLGGGGP